MEIEILKKLRDNSKGFPNEELQFEIQGIGINEIQQLEQTWNSGIVFPKALRELLFLAGNYCYVLDYSIWDNMQEMQEENRDAMQYRGHVFSRPFFVIDNYGGMGQFLFVYLDENQIDPMVYSYTSDAISRERALDTPLGYTLSSLINRGIEAVQEGRNPF